MATKPKQQSQGINSQVLGQAKTLGNRFQQITGVDLARLPQMSDQELGEIADRAHAMTRLREVLPILEKHFQTLLQGQVEYEQFCERVLKEAEKSGKAIDKAMMNAFLADRGYQKHLQLMQQKSGLQSQLQDARFASQVDLANLDFKTALQLVKLKHDRSVAQINQKVPMAQANLQRSEELRQIRQQRMDLVNNGTKGTLGRVKSFFGG